MTTTDAIPEDARKGSKKPLLLGAALALALGGGAFHAVRSGLVLEPPRPELAESQIEALPDVGFVAMEPIVISLGGPASRRHLRFEAQLEVAAGYEEEVARMLPRVTDVLNGYLRALDLSELEETSSLIRLRSQMLRRVQIVTGEGRVRDLLVMEFVLN